VNRSFAVVTFGCRVNQADSLVIESELMNRGARMVPAEHADLVVVNTCSVTASADQGARQTIRRLVRLNPDVRVVVTGCYATRRPGDVASLPNVVQVVSNVDKDRLTPLLGANGWLTTSQRFGDGNDSCGAVSAPGHGGRTALTLRVQTGCEERCSYCIIPQTRGRGRSQPVKDVVTRVDAAMAAGYREIVLTGVHLGSYGRDLGDGSSLAGLLSALASRDEDVLFRVSSLEPMDCTGEIVDLVAQSGRLAPHFHLPLQHASNRMLTAMRRPYQYEDYHALVLRIRRLMPHASIGSDVIVGFPGESADDFDVMERRLRDLPLTHLHVFPYSDREGTDACALPGRVEGATIRARGRVVRDISADMARGFRQSQSGSTCRALTLDDGWSAVTPNYLKLRLDRQVARNEWIDVKIGEDALNATVL
jgi:threonylcarbamoyladenosine tRNA methylthiotransferase MtaB